MDNNKWSTIRAQCQKKDQHLTKIWYDSWQNHIATDDVWQGGTRYEHIEGSNENCAIIPYSFQTIGPFQFASLTGNFYPHRGIPNTGVDPKLIENTTKKISQIVAAAGLRTSGFRMGPVEQDDKFISALVSNLKNNNWKVISKDIGHHFGVKLLSSEEEFLNSVSSKRKSNIRRCHRVMERDGTVNIEQYSNISEEQWSKVFKEIETIESNAWVAANGEPKFIGKAKQSFWNDLAADEWFRGALSTWILYFNDKPVSYSLELDTDDTRYGLSCSFDKAVAKYGTGVMLRIKNIAQATAAGKKILNEGLGDGGYKATWGSSEISKVVDLVVFPPTVKGRISYYSGILHENINKIKKAIKAKKK